MASWPKTDRADLLYEKYITVPYLGHVAGTTTLGVHAINNNKRRVHPTEMIVNEWFST